MPLLFQKPKRSEKRLKAMLYGMAGVGKTTASIMFPRPAIIDTERGTEMDQYVDAINAREGVVLRTASFDTIMDQVRMLAVEEHPYQTLVIDPISVVYDSIADAHKKKVGTDFSKHLVEAWSDWKRLTLLLSALDMNVVMTAHSKNEWINGESTGHQTWDGPKKSDYWVDLIVEVTREGQARFGNIRKSRITQLPVDTTFEFSYDEIANRYGRDILEKDAVPLDSERVHLIDLINRDPDGEAKAAKMLKRAEVATLSELTQDQVQKAIEWLSQD
tara:strand:+ start:565 stop:1386 length:822 start_codon:yes stop_codon:yes gene_type:complete